MPYHKILVFIFCLLAGNALFGQKNTYTVTAKSGLTIRSAPSLQAERIGSLSYGSFIEVTAITEHPLSIKDDGKIVAGHWALISNGEDYKGYIFDGFLIKNKNSKRDSGIFCDENGGSCHSKFDFHDVEISILNYQAEKHSLKTADSIYAYEYVFNEISDRIININPVIEVDSYEVSFTYHENFYEQFDYSKVVSQEMEENPVNWQGQQAFQKLEGKANHFLIPRTPYEELELLRKEKMGVRDTLNDLSGEAWNVATLVYKEKPCLYILSSFVLKVILYPPKEAPIARYVVISLSYGC